MPAFLIYGATGYTGALIAREAVARGMHPVLAGRSAPALGLLARDLRLEHRVFSLDHPPALEAGLRGIHVVLHCAGPFNATFRPMVRACLRTGVHYLDITGEIGVFEALAAHNVEARAAGLMLLPGAGFDVVPSDCLAVHLKRRLPSATYLALGFQSGGRLSRGTATTVAENLHLGGLVRQGGILQNVPAAWKTRTIDFGAGPVKAITIPWGDVATAFHSTGIPNIEVYTAAALGLRLAARASRYLGRLLSSSFVQVYLKRRIQAAPPGPTAEERSKGRTFLWGEAADGAGRKVVARLRAPESYTLTAQAALAIVARILAGEAPAGFQTPALAYGADFILGLKGVRREDE